MKNRYNLLGWKRILNVKKMAISYKLLTVRQRGVKGAGFPLYVIYKGCTDRKEGQTWLGIRIKIVVGG